MLDNLLGTRLIFTTKLAWTGTNFLNLNTELFQVHPLIEGRRYSVLQEAIRQRHMVYSCLCVYCICVEGVDGHAGEALTSSSLLVQYKKERTAFWQLNFIGDIGVEGGMVSQCTACLLANCVLPSLFTVFRFLFLFMYGPCYDIEARVWSARVILNICFISFPRYRILSLKRSSDRFFL